MTSCLGHPSGRWYRALMTIFVNDAKTTFAAATRFISERDDRARQILRAWDKSGINHCFKDKKSLKRAVRKNQKTLKYHETIETLFTANNYLFSTRACGREETLYFENRIAKQTGRLRQQHRKGPLAKIDRRSKTHRFLSQRRFRFLKKWNKRHKGCLARFRISEERLKAGKRHLEFAHNGTQVSGWHLSEGRVGTSRRDIEGRIGSALKEILGTRHK